MRAEGTTVEGAVARSTSPRDSAPPVAHERRQLRVTGFVPVEAKLRGPVPREGFVERDRLLTRLLQSRSTPVVLVVAPAGYGKTTLLAQWAEADDRPFAWVSVDDADRDPAVLVDYVALALHRVEHVEANVLANPAQDPAAISTRVLPRLGRAIADRSRPFVLVLDDVHHLDTPRCLEVLTVIADHLPAGSQLVLAGRTRIGLPGRSRRPHDTLSLEATDLALTVAESAALLRATGLDLDHATVATLAARTEGWPAATYLAALILRKATDKAAAVAAFAGDDRIVADYLQDVILQDAPDELVDFLTKTSVLDRLNGPLCDAVLGGVGSAQTLTALERANLLVIPLDAARTWYRYHYLLTTMLRSELHRREPAAEAELHRRAAAWHEAYGDVRDAVRHARAAGDVARAARLLWSHTAGWLAAGRRATVEELLAEFTPEDLRSVAKLALAAAWCALETGRSAEPWVVHAAEHGSYDVTQRGEADEIAAAVAVLRATLGADGLAAMRRDAELADRMLPRDNEWRTLVHLLVGVADHLGGDPDSGQRELETCVALCREMDVPSVLTVALCQLALIMVGHDDWEQAAAHAAEAERLMERFGLHEVATLGPNYATFAMVAAHAERAERAQAHVRHARRLIALGRHFAPWLGVQSRIVVAETYVMLGDSAAARVVLSEAAALMHQIPDAPLLRERLESAWQRSELLPLTTRLGPTALTSAELRVLQYLPTHLSFEEIGKRLFVSRNTVKTQAVSAYRKLGVGSRNEAVERAQMLGLIEP